MQRVHETNGSSYECALNCPAHRYFSLRFNVLFIYSKIASGLKDRTLGGGGVKMLLMIILAHFLEKQELACLYYLGVSHTQKEWDVYIEIHWSEGIGQQFRMGATGRWEIPETSQFECKGSIPSIRKSRCGT